MGSSFESMCDFHVDNFKLAESVLRTFGHMIENVELFYDYMNKTESTIIEKYINTYCSDSLLDLKLMNFTSNPLASMSRPFAKLQQIFLYGKTDRIAAGNATLNEIFPALENLILNVEGIQDKRCLDIEFPNLKSVHVLFSFQIVTGFDPIHVQKLLENNPQVRCLSTSFAPFSFLKMVTSLLPRLEELVVAMMPTNDDYHGEIRFKNVKMFTLNVILSPPPNFAFDQIEVVRFHNYEPVPRK